jgi:hypothetical protein
MYWLIVGIAILIFVLIVALYILGYLEMPKSWIFYLFIYGAYFLFILYYIMPTPPPQRAPLYDSSNVGYTAFYSNWLTTLNSSLPTPRINTAPQMTDVYSRDISTIKEAYRLGFPLELGEPTTEWVATAKEKLASLGDKSYYTIIAESNKLKISALLNPSITLHDEDTMTESIYHYNSFDTIASLENGHLYIYTRPEWSWITEKKICPFSRTPIPDIVLKTIDLRAKIARILPPPTTMGNGVLNTNTSTISSAGIQKLSQFLDLPTNPEFSVSDKKDPEEVKITNFTEISLSELLESEHKEFENKENNSIKISNITNDDIKLDNPDLITEIQNSTNNENVKSEKRIHNPELIRELRLEALTERLKSEKIKI